MSKTIRETLAATDWKLLAEQKLTLIELKANNPEQNEHIEGLLCFLDAIQDAADAEGLPVVWLTDDMMTD